MPFHKKNFFLAKHCICLLVAVCFASSAVCPLPFVQAQVVLPAAGVLNLPPPGTLVPLSSLFHPVVLKGLTLYPENPFKFDFILDTGDTSLEGEALKDEAAKLIKYFMASLTVPENEMWVNLSPDEADRIIPESFGHTEMGRDLLVQDYLLKQLSSSLMHPDNELGEKFWKRVWANVGSGLKPDPTLLNESVNTLNKIWIVPDKATVYTNASHVFVSEIHLKVMLEEDYEAMRNNIGSRNIKHDAVGAYRDTPLPSDLIRETILPAIEREVNEGENFANLRQIVNSMILATWYKRNLRLNVFNRVYANQNKTAGIDVDDPTIAQKVYDQYLKTFQKGVYDFIREDYDPVTQTVIPRKYFAGGIDATGTSITKGPRPQFFGQAQKVEAGVVDVDRAMLAMAEKKEGLVEALLDLGKKGLTFQMQDGRLSNANRPMYDILSDILEDRTGQAYGLILHNYL